jgi:transaldolase
MIIQSDSPLARSVHDFIINRIHAHAGVPLVNPSLGLWQRLSGLGSQLWLDTGSMEQAKHYWTDEFAALTTNNTLLNNEVQTGQYDDLIFEAAAMLDDFKELDPRQKLLEIAFILNATHGLRLVGTFNAFVSVEEHTDLAHTVDAAVEYAKRFHAIHPTRFIVKIPFTPAGLLATRKISSLGIAVNHTLNFSARQNYLIARIAQPAFVNVFLGRLNSFVKSNDLGNGDFVGERATLASQKVVRMLRRDCGIRTKQIGASFRNGQQVADLAGLDVMTIPPKVAGEFLELGLAPDQVSDKTELLYAPGVRNPSVIQDAGLNTLWDVEDAFMRCVDALEKENLDALEPKEVVQLFADHGCADALIDWTADQAAVSRAEGKIPKIDNWKNDLSQGRIGLDALMNFAGLNSFTADQAAMDNRIREVLNQRA